MYKRAGKMYKRVIFLIDAKKAPPDGEASDMIA